MRPNVFVIAAVVAGVWVASTPAYACHRFSVWKYPTPQRCRAATVPPDHSWYVEIAAPKPPPDERTPEQINDALEHDQAVKAHKDELNSGLRLLEEQEKMK